MIYQGFIIPLQLSGGNILDPYRIAFGLLLSIGTCNVPTSTTTSTSAAQNSQKSKKQLFVLAVFNC